MSGKKQKIMGLVIVLMMMLPAAGTLASLGSSSGMKVTLSASKTNVYVYEKIVFTAKIEKNGGSVTTLASHQYKYYYRFDFGDRRYVAGYTDDSEINVTHSYSYSGTYNAKVYVKDQQTGEEEEKWLSSSITVHGGNKAPVARIKLSSPTAKVGENIRFDGSSSYDPDGYIKTYIWSFGDGRMGNGKIVTHSYNSPGIYTITLTVTDNKGKKDTETKTITVNSQPTPSEFTVSLSASKTTVEIGEKIVFTAKIENSNGGVTTLASHQYKYYYRFDFGDNKHLTGYVDDAGVVKASHVYSISGKYNAKVTVTERATGSSKTDVVAVNVKGNGGNQPPVANAGGPYKQKSRIVSFDASKSFDSDGRIVSYSWDFGDGRHIRNWRYTKIMHMYWKEGVYTVTLTVKDNKGATGTDTTTVTIGNVNDGGGNGGDLSVSLSVEPKSVEAMDPITCTIVIGDNGGSSPHVSMLSTNGVTTFAGGDGRYSYKVFFGNGKYLIGSTDDTKIVVQHSYSKTGSYTVYVTVKDEKTGNEGKSNSVTVSVTSMANRPPTAFAGGPYDGVVGEPVVFDGSASYDPDRNVLFYRWDFDDDGVWDTSWLRSKTVEHVYLEPYEGYAVLEVKDTDGLTDSCEAEVLVRNARTTPITGGVDQSQEQSDGYVKIYNGRYFAQSFVPQKYGKVTGVELLLSRKGIASYSSSEGGSVSALLGGFHVRKSRSGFGWSNSFNGKLVVSIYKKLDRLSIQDQLASVSVNGWDIQKSSGWVYVSFGEGFKVKIGETYYIVVHQQGGDEKNYYRWYYGSGNPYEHGSSYSAEGYISGDWNEDKDRDFCFREYGEYSGEEPDGNVERWAVIIGALQTVAGICYHADQDAYDMRNVLVNHGWQSSHIRVLISPTFDQVKQAMDWLSSMDDQDDNALLSWTSHGSTYGIALRDTRIYYSSFGGWLDDLDSKGVVVVAENCHSGAAIPYLEKEGRVILTSSSSDEPSGGNMSRNSPFIYLLADETGEWSSRWGWPKPFEGKDGAFARDDPDTNKDYGGNNDGWISAEEAYAYAKYWHEYAGWCHPQMSDMYPGDLNIAKRN
ncbi:MAG: PKD domain-containing protein [Thermoplasmata archaeon]|nr:PKD domain-containing protein [Thermoplasmata archaeon]